MEEEVLGASYGGHPDAKFEGNLMAWQSGSAAGDSASAHEGKQISIKASNDESIKLPEISPQKGSSSNKGVT